MTVPRAAEFGDVIERAAQRKRCRKWRHRQRLGHDHGRCPARSGAGDDRFATAGGCPRGRGGDDHGTQERGYGACQERGADPADRYGHLCQCSDSGAASGDDVVWPAIATLAASDATTTYTAKLTAGANDSVIQTQASLAGTTEGGASVSDTSNLITLRVANEADPVLTATFDPENFVSGKDIALTFKVANEGSALLNAGTLVVPLPKDTSVATVPTGATCTATACTLPVAALAAGGSTAATVPLTVDAGSSLTRLAGAGALKPDTAGAFIAQSATATADLQMTSDTKEPYEITIDPPTGSGCSLTSVSTQPDAGVSGVTLVRDKLLNFSISGCDPGTAVPVVITVQGDALPEGTVAIKADDSGVSGAQIAGATITGNTVSYTLTDNGSLDLDPADGELRDPVAVAILGGSGIYVPFIAVPIPYWVLGLLAGLMGWLGYRRLRLA